MSTEPPVLPPLICERCGATNSPLATACFLCDKRGADNPYAPAASLKALAAPVNPTERRLEGVFLGLWGICLLLTVLIGVGIGMQAPGALVPYFIVIGPAYLTTGIRAAFNSSRNQPNRASSLFMAFMWSGLLTIGVIGMLIVASIALLFVFCLSMY